MVMITGTRAIPAVNHVASSTLLPTLLAPRNKYAIIYLRAADGQEAGRKHLTVKPHTRTLVSLSVLHSKTYTHYMLAQGHIKWAFPVFLSLIMYSIHVHTFVYACVCEICCSFYSLIL